MKSRVYVLSIMIHQCYQQQPVCWAEQISTDQIFRILGQSDYRAEGHAHFCERLHVYLQVHVIWSTSFSFRKMIFKIFFHEFQFPTSWRVQSRGITLRAFCGCTLLSRTQLLYILAAYRYFQNLKRWSHESIR